MGGSLPVLNGVVTPMNSLGWDYPTERGPFYLIYNWWRSPSFTVFIRIPLVPRFVQGVSRSSVEESPILSSNFFQDVNFASVIGYEHENRIKSGVLWKKVVPCQREKRSPRDFFHIFFGNTPPELGFCRRPTERRKQTLDQFLLDGGNKQGSIYWPEISMLKKSLVRHLGWKWHCPGIGYIYPPGNDHMSHQTGKRKIIFNSFLGGGIS